MATPAKKAAAAKKAAPARKPPAPVLEVKRAAPGPDATAAAPAELVQSDQQPVQVYRATGRILRNGLTLRPANPATGRQADTVELTDREAYGLRGFVELLPQQAAQEADSDNATE
jgi:hypothetical protein